MVWVKGHQLQNGKYVIQEVLGQGGFGITYKALHVPLNYYVVVKTPNEYLKYNTDYDKYVDKFIKEGKTLAKLSKNSHPHIVRVQDLFQEQDTYCLIMDFVDGENLFQLVKRQGRILEEKAVKYIQQIGSALSTIHKAGLVHRDAHPGNIMLGKDGNAILIDFGIAKEFIPTTQTSMSDTGNKGFAPYEQLFKGSRELNVDVYCLAATLYFLLTSKYPTNSITRKLDNARLIPPQEIIPSISNKVNRAIMKGMELEARFRPQTIDEWLYILLIKSNLNLSFQLYKTIDKGIYQLRKLIKQQISARSIVITGKIPWRWLIQIIFTYGVISFRLASSQVDMYIWLLCWFMAVFVNRAVAVNLDGVWVWIVTGIWLLLVWAMAMAVAVAEFSVDIYVSALAWFVGVAKASYKLKYESFSVEDQLTILSFTSTLGIGLGWLTWYLLSLLNSSS